MKSIDGKFLSPSGWNRFFRDLIRVQGTSWRIKDYKELGSILKFEHLKGTLLDVGCAFGDGILYLKDKCPKIDKFYGTDVSIKAIDICKANPKLVDAEFFVHDIMTPLPLSFDYIICLQTLEHVTSPTTVMTNLADATNIILVVAAPYKNKRPDIRHVWSFDEDDFDHTTDFYKIRGSNIYWIKARRKEKWKQ